MTQSIGRIPPCLILRDLAVRTKAALTQLLFKLLAAVQGMSLPIFMINLIYDNAFMKTGSAWA